MRIGRGDILDSYYHSIWSATGSGAATSHFLKFYVSNGTAGATNQVEALSMNGVGQVTKPNTPFVMAHINTTSGRANQGNQEKVPWDVIHGRGTNSNVGNCFNTSNNRFTAPIAGRYLFVLSLNEVGNNIVYHRVNNTQVSYAEYREGGSQWDHMDASFIYDMNANDYYETWSLLTGTGQRWNGGGSAHRS